MSDSPNTAAIKILEAQGFTCIRFKPSGDTIPHEEIECALALFRALRQKGGRYVAVKVEAPTYWNIVEPRTQEALMAALETETQQ